MSQITKCDRCGEETKNKLGMSRINFYLEHDKKMDFDLCYKCIFELAYIVEDWVEKYNKKNMQFPKDDRGVEYFDPSGGH